MFEYSFVFIFSARTREGVKFEFINNGEQVEDPPRRLWEYANALGAEGWELVDAQSIPMPAPPVPQKYLTERWVFKRKV